MFWLASPHAPPTSCQPRPATPAPGSWSPALLCSRHRPRLGALVALFPLALDARRPRARGGRQYRRGNFRQGDRARTWSTTSRSKKATFFRDRSGRLPSRARAGRGQRQEPPVRPATSRSRTPSGARNSARRPFPPRKRTPRRAPPSRRRPPTRPPSPRATRPRSTSTARVIRSPVNGYVTNLTLRIGDYATPARPSSPSSTATRSGSSATSRKRSCRASMWAITRTSGSWAGGRKSPATSKASRAASPTPTAMPTPRACANVNPIFTWVRLAQRIPVRIDIDHVPQDVTIAAGQTCTIEIDDHRRVN